MHIYACMNGVNVRTLACSNECMLPSTYVCVCIIITITVVRSLLNSIIFASLISN